MEEQPDNVVPMPTPEAVPPTSPGVEDTVPAPSAPVAETESPETATDSSEDPVEQILKNVDIKTLSRDEIFSDIIAQAKLFAFRLMVGVALLEQKMISEQEDAPEKEAPAESEQAVS